MKASTILIVEDEAIVARDIREQLVELGYDPIADTPRGEDAIVLAGKLHPDLVLMDIQLAGQLDGVAAAEAIRDQFALPVVFLTAFAAEATLERAKHADPYGYIVKPFNARELRNVVEIALFKSQAERRLRENERLLQQAQEVGGVGSGTYDIAAGVWTRSRVLESLLGIDAHYPGTADDLFRLVHPSQRDRILADLRAAIAERRRFEGECLIVRADNGEERWLYGRGDVEYGADGTPRRLVCSLQDITERRRADEILHEALAQFDDVVASQPAGIYRIRVRANGDWRSEHDPIFSYEFVSDRYCELRGHAREELLANPYLTVKEIHPDDRDDFLNANEQAKETHEPFRWEGRMLRNGVIHWVHFESRPRVLANGDTLWTGAIFDITAQHQVLEEKAKFEAQSRQLQRAESLGRMAGAVAHHFNNLLGAVMGNLDLALAEPPDSAEHLELLQEAMAAAHQAAEVSGQMLTYVGESFAKRRNVDLTSLCEQTCPRFRASKPETGTLDCAHPSPGPIVRANELQLQQALSNIVTNAWEAIGPQPGTVRIEISTVDAARVDRIEPLPHRLARDGPGLCVRQHHRHRRRYRGRPARPGLRPVLLHEVRRTRPRPRRGPRHRPRARRRNRGRERARPGDHLQDLPPDEQARTEDQIPEDRRPKTEMRNERKAREPSSHFAFPSSVFGPRSGRQHRATAVLLVLLQLLQQHVHRLLDQLLHRNALALRLAFVRAQVLLADLGVDPDFRHHAPAGTALCP